MFEEAAAIREDSGGDTRATYDQLVQRFSKARVFMDVESSHRSVLVRLLWIGGVIDGLRGSGDPTLDLVEGLRVNGVI